MADKKGRGKTSFSIRPDLEKDVRRKMVDFGFRFSDAIEDAVAKWLAAVGSEKSRPCSTCGVVSFLGCPHVGEISTNGVDFQLKDGDKSVIIHRIGVRLGAAFRNLTPEQAEELVGYAEWLPSKEKTATVEEPNAAKPGKSPHKRRPPGGVTHVD